MLSAVLTGFSGSFIAPLIYRLSRKHAGRIMALIPFGLFIYFLTFLSTVSDKGAVTFFFPWVTGLNIHLSFLLDGLSILFCAVISFICIPVLIYSDAYFKNSYKNIGQFYAFMLFFMSSMLGLVLSDNIIVMYVFWELTSISSYLLIGFNHEEKSARKAAWQALLITSMGGLSLLAGLVLLGEVGGSYEISGLLRKGESITHSSLYPAIFILVALGAFTKSAQFPFHFWLPDAMEAPTPVSTYLHSATMVKAGIYLLARMSPVLGGTVLWHSVVVAVGAVTMILSAWMALRQTDLKKILAYSTITILGTLVLLLGNGTHAAVEAAMAYIMIHALYKAAFFLTAGIVDHETGTRNIEKLSGLFRYMPITAGAAILAGLSMAGLPPLFGFIGKELLYSATLESPLADTFLTGVALVTNILLVAASGMAGYIPFFGKNSGFDHDVHEPSFGMWIGPVLLSVLGVAIGLMPNLLGTIWVAPAVAAVTGEPVKIELALMHGLNLQLLLSMITFACGLVVFWKRKPILNLLPSSAGRLSGLTPSSLYGAVVENTTAFAGLQTRFFQNGHLHFYILTIIVTTIFLVGFSLLRIEGDIVLPSWSDIHIFEYALVLVIMTATVMVILAPSRLFAIIALGVLGYAVVLFYIVYGAPDLAMTQFSIDTLTVILLVLVVYRLPRYSKYSSKLERLRDAVPALTAGAMITLIILVDLSMPPTTGISAFFVENAYIAAKGRNIVNVILVDFRALDTMGEITVLVVAGIGVFSLLKLSLNRSNTHRRRKA